MEIDNIEYLYNQSRIVSKVRSITLAMVDILLTLDNDLSEIIARRRESAFSAVKIVTNTLRDYEEELIKMRAKYENQKNRKEE